MKSTFFPVFLSYGTINMKNNYQDTGFNANLKKPFQTELYVYVAPQKGWGLQSENASAFDRKLARRLQVPWSVQTSGEWYLK